MLVFCSEIVERRLQNAQFLICHRRKKLQKVRYEDLGGRETGPPFRARSEEVKKVANETEVFEIEQTALIYNREYDKYMQDPQL